MKTICRVFNKDLEMITKLSAGFKSSWHQARARPELGAGLASGPPTKAVSIEQQTGRQCCRQLLHLLVTLCLNSAVSQAFEVPLYARI